ncbi:hypothetical protein H4N47_20950 [Streptomyces sp. I5]|nr:hypothetical protein [Streptomyces sp. I5]
MRSGVLAAASAGAAVGDGVARLEGARTRRWIPLAAVTPAGFTGDPTPPFAARDVVLDSYAYDPAGRLAEHTDAMARTTRYTYYDDGLPARPGRHPRTSEIKVVKTRPRVGSGPGRVPARPCPYNGSGVRGKRLVTTASSARWRSIQSDGAAIGTVTWI